MLEFLNLGLKQKVCIFTKKVWKLLDGLVVESPRSPLLIDIYMDWFETQFLQDRNIIKYTQNVLYSDRYVDDV